MIKGLDISNYQGTVNGTQIKNDGYEVVYIMATEGVSFTSPTLQAQYQTCKDGGLKIGFYHFLLPSDDGTAQAQHFYNATKGMSMDCRVVADCETKNGYTQAQITQVVMDFANEIKRLLGSQIMIYASPYWANANLGQEVAQFPYWIADYTSASSPMATNNWGSNYAGWQWSSTGTVNGCPNGNTDLDWFTDGIFIDKFVPSSGSSSFTGLNGVSLQPVQNSTTVSGGGSTPQPKSQPQPTQPTGSIIVGSTVEITGGVYGGQGSGAGTTIGGDYLWKPYTVQQISNDGTQALIEQLESWVYIKNLKLIRGGGSSSTGGNIVVGSQVRVLNGVYAGASAGITIPSGVVGQTYPVIQINTSNQTALLGNGLDSWIAFRYLQLVSGGSYFVIPTAYRTGEKVKIVGNTYSTGQEIPSWAKEQIYTVQEVNLPEHKVLLKEIQSWVNFNGVRPC